jgi:signal peptidase I
MQQDLSSEAAPYSQGACNTSGPQGQITAGQTTHGRTLRPWLIAVLAASAGFCVIITGIVLALTAPRVLDVRGKSMTPGIQDGDNVLVINRRGSLSRGTIIVMRSPSDSPNMVLGRVVGLPGEVIEIRKGRTLVNGDYIEEPYVSADQNRRPRDMAPISVLDHTYFVMADNRDWSKDSRDWGLIGDNQIYGKVVMRY